MSMGRRDKPRQDAFWVASSSVATGPGHPFYEELNEILAKAQFDKFVEGVCEKFYAERVGRPSMPPGVYFRFLMIGYFEGLDSERGIAWRVSDSLALRQFLGYALDERTPEHSTISRTRQRMDVETHQLVFNWILKVLAKRKLLKGKTLGIDATTLEANAALRSIVRRDTGDSYEEFLTQLAKASGIKTPTREDLARIDKDRPGKGSNKDWEHPHDPDARITKMKDGRTHLAHKAEQVVDMQTGAIVSLTVQPASDGDTRTMSNSLDEAASQIAAVLEDTEAAARLSNPPLRELVADKGYHSNDTLVLLEQAGYRSYVSEPQRGRRRWANKELERQATYANRRRGRCPRAKRLQALRGELLERTHAHLYETGGMRRTHLRGHSNILKRLLIHASAFNLGLVMRKLLGAGTPRGLRAVLRRLVAHLFALLALALRPKATTRRPTHSRFLSLGNFRTQLGASYQRLRCLLWPPAIPAKAYFSTGC